MPAPINAPSLALDDADLVDWLELTALFSSFGVARLDALLGSLLEQKETSEDNIGERDRQREQIVERLENEVDHRQRTLKGSYPFFLSDTAEEVSILEEWREPRFSFYLICLITAHVTGSVVLNKPPTGGLLTKLRNDVFQIVATLGLAGLAKGPAFSVGWPRRTGESIVQLLTRAAEIGGGFSARNPPGIYVAPKEKDGGVDVIAWTDEGTPPPSTFYWGQTASGGDWLEKPVMAHASLFKENYMQDHMTGNYAYITLIPFRVLDQRLFHSQSKFHKALLDRLRLPLRAMQGLEMSTTGTHIDSAHRVPEITQWINEFMDYAQAA